MDYRTAILSAIPVDCMDAAAITTVSSIIYNAVMEGRKSSPSIESGAIDVNIFEVKITKPEINSVCWSYLTEK